jgi:nucleoside-diphosphate-sugar epimerase
MKNIIEFAKKKDIKKIFYSSTSSIYETANRPTPYNMSKLFAEQLLTDSKLNFTIMRYFNAYGKYQQEKMVISRFINLALNDKPLTIFSNGKQTRDFTFIEDAINATIIISDSDKTDYKTLDIGTGKETNILELVSTIKEITDSNSKIIHKDPPEERIPFEVKRRACNPKMLKELLGFECKTTISEGIRKTVEHIKNKE